MGIRDISHSCCPEKTNIEAPKFERTGLNLNIPARKAQLEEWKCSGCQTVIYVVVDGNDAATSL